LNIVNVLNKLADALSGLSFYENNNTSRGIVHDEVSKILDLWLNAGTIYDYAIICDDSNNSYYLSNINVDVLLKTHINDGFVYVPIRKHLNS